MRAIVVGSGVSGLTTAVVLAEAGIATRLVTRDEPESTTSIVAAAVWYPYEAPPIASVPAWGRRSLEVFRTLAGEPAAGVFSMQISEVSRTPVPPQPWSDTVEDFRFLEPPELPPGRVAGFTFQTVRIEPPIYLRYLVERFIAAGGEYEVDAVGIDRLTDLAGPSTVVANCTGLASGQLVPDPGCYPIRGQVVAVANPGIDSGIIDESDPSRITYVLPRSDEVILGGTREVGSATLEPDAATTERILADAAEVESRITGAPVVAVRVGLRPGRDGVRVGLDAESRWPIVHNYGHAGNGYGLSWGCAEDVLGLVQAIASG